MAQTKKELLLKKGKEKKIKEGKKAGEKGGRGNKEVLLNINKTSENKNTTDGEKCDLGQKMVKERLEEGEEEIQ